MLGKEAKPYEVRLLDKDGRTVASVWMDCPDEDAAVATAAREAVTYRLERAIGYEVRRGRRLIMSFSW